jgi:hypothetical protein
MGYPQCLTITESGIALDRNKSITVSGLFDALKLRGIALSGLFDPLKWEVDM